MLYFKEQFHFFYLNNLYFKILISKHQNWTADYKKEKKVKMKHFKLKES